METCGNCTQPSADLEAVHRVYLLFDSGRVVGAEPVAEVERWCLSCRTVYPNEPTHPNEHAGG